MLDDVKLPTGDCRVGGKMAGGRTVEETHFDVVLMVSMTEDDKNVDDGGSRCEKVYKAP